MSGPSPVDGLLARLAAGEIDRQVRLGAAGGALPLPPPDLLRVQAHLALQDPDPEVRSRADQALRDRGEAPLASLASDRDLCAEMARFLATAPDIPEPVLEALVRNPACPDGTVVDLAGRAAGSLVDALLLNQVRLERSPEIVTALEDNPALSGGQRSRLAEIRRHLIDAPPEPAGEEPELPAEQAALLAEAAREAEEEESRREAKEEPAAPGAGESAAEADDGPGISAYQRILKLSASEKVKLAFTGGAEDRSILIRDGNRVVARTVLKSPRITDKEIESFVNMRSLSDEVMRSIAANRDWLKSYTVVIGLIRNPKTPPAISMNLMARLKQRDLNTLAGDRNVPEVVRRQARKNFVARTQGRR